MSTHNTQHTTTPFSHTTPIRRRRRRERRGRGRGRKRTNQHEKQRGNLARSVHEEGEDVGKEGEVGFFKREVATSSTLSGTHSSMSIPSVATVSPVAERFLRLTASRRALLSCGQKTNRQNQTDWQQFEGRAERECVCVCGCGWVFNVRLVCVERGERCEVRDVRDSGLNADL